jgi:hypothetical protein
MNFLATKQKVAAVLFAWLILGPAACTVAAGAIAQGFETHTTDISPGTLLGLVASTQDTVEPASQAKAAQLVGVAGDKPLIELSGNNSKSTVQVVVSGTTPALVSDINGPVKAGDKITASPVSGIGMKATDPTEVVGTAQTDLGSVTTGNKTVTGQDGSSQTIKVGLVPVAVNVAYYSTASSSPASSLVPPLLQTIANTVTGRQVSPIRVLLGTAALLFGFITITVMLYISVRSGITSIGRNPLAEGALRKGFFDVFIAAFGVLSITVVLVYVILRS